MGKRFHCRQSIGIEEIAADAMSGQFREQCQGGLNEYSILEFDAPNLQRLEELGNGLPIGLWDYRSPSRWLLLGRKI
jgi:hypothetical protein